MVKYPVKLSMEYDEESGLCAALMEKDKRDNESSGVSNVRTLTSKSCPLISCILFWEGV